MLIGTVADVEIIITLKQTKTINTSLTLVEPVRETIWLMDSWLITYWLNRMEKKK